MTNSEDKLRTTWRLLTVELTRAVVILNDLPRAHYHYDPRPAGEGGWILVSTIHGINRDDVWMGWALKYRNTPDDGMVFGVTEHGLGCADPEDGTEWEAYDCAPSTPLQELELMARTLLQPPPDAVGTIRWDWEDRQ